MYAPAPAYRVIMRHCSSLAHYISPSIATTSVKSQFLEPVCYRFIAVSYTHLDVYKRQERKKIAGQFIFEFIILPDKKAHVRVFDLKVNYEERNQMQDLEPIGDAYWAEYRYHSTSRDVYKRQLQTKLWSVTFITETSSLII